MQKSTAPDHYPAQRPDGQERAWAKQAPVHAISVARRHFKHNGIPNPVALHDRGAANAQLTMEATSHGLLVHQMAGFHHDKAREVFGIPEGSHPVSASPSAIPATRRLLLEFVMTDHWRHTAPILSK